MTLKELRELDNDGIILRVFTMGMMMCDSRYSKSREWELMMCFQELERRGIVDSAQGIYERTH